MTQDTVVMHVHLRDRVIIDGDQTIKGVVTGIQIRAAGYWSAEVSYVHGGIPQSPWIEGYRLEKIDD